MRRQRKDREPTKTSRVWELMLRANDYLTWRQIQEATDLSPANVASILHALLDYGAVECFESNGKLWWYATPGGDRRSRIIELRAPEPPGNRGGGRKKD